MKACINKLLVLLLFISLTSCSSRKFIFFSEDSSFLNFYSENYSTPNWQSLNTEEIYQYCLEQDKASFTGRVLLLACTHQMLSRDNLSSHQREYAIEHYNNSLFTILNPLINNKDNKHINSNVLSIYVDGEVKKLDNIFLNDNISVIDRRLEFKVFGELGVDGVIINKNSEKSIDKYYPLEGLFRPITFTFDGLKQNGDKWELRIKSHQINQIQSIELAKEFYTLRYSPAAAFIVLIEHANINELDWLGLVNASKAESRRGIFAIEEISTTKTPIVMIHGLNSEPLIWRYLTLAILNNKDLHNRYQVWHAYYPSGPPPFYSAMMLRKIIKDLLDSFPSLAEKNEAVFIGHSLGGILSKLMTTNPDYQLWDTTFTIRPENLLISAEEQQIKDIFIFDQLFKKNKVFFLDTPHRGSSTAESFVGQISSALVTLPDSFLGLFRKFINRISIGNITTSMFPFLNSYGPDSVQALRPGYPLMESLNKIKINGDVFSIIGSNGRLYCEIPYQCTDITDGIVPYSSAHNEQAIKEILVRSSHDSYQSQKAIDFILRNL